MNKVKFTTVEDMLEKFHKIYNEDFTLDAEQFFNVLNSTKDPVEGALRCLNIGTYLGYLQAKEELEGKNEL